MANWGKRRIVKNITKKNRRADKLIRKGKFNRALNLMHDVLAVIENKIGTANIALAKQHLRLARFRIKEAKRAQYEMSLQICNAEVDRETLSQSYSGRLVLRKLAKRNYTQESSMTCSELFGLLHFAEAVYHGEKAFEVLKQASKPETGLLDSVVFLLGKLYDFFDVHQRSVDNSEPASFSQSEILRHRHLKEPALGIRNGRMPYPAFGFRSTTDQINTTAVTPY